MFRFVRQQPEFGKLWLGQAVSAFGSRITAVAMPLAAVGLLGASPFEMGVLSALSLLPHLLFGLAAGVWVDRLSRRNLLVVTDVGRAIVLGMLPALGLAGLLRMEHLYVAAFLSGVLTLLFEVAAASLVPVLVGRANLLPANSALLINSTLANTVGPSLGGVLVQVLTAPVAIAFDAASFLVSAACTLLIRVEPGPSSTSPGRLRVWPEAVAGLRLLFGHPILSPIVVSASVGALAGAVQAALLVLYMVRDLSLGPAFVGLAVATSGLSSVLGALLGPTCCKRFGLGRTYIAGGLFAGLAGLLLASAQGPRPLVMLCLLGGQALAGIGQPLYSLPQVTLRQSLVPDQLLGRVNAAWRFLVFGVQPLGALAGGALGDALGVRATLVIGSFGILAACGWALQSRVRSVREVPSLVG